MQKHEAIEYMIITNPMYDQDKKYNKITMVYHQNYLMIPQQASTSISIIIQINSRNIKVCTEHYAILNEYKKQIIRSKRPRINIIDTTNQLVVKEILITDL